MFSATPFVPDGTVYDVGCQQPLKAVCHVKCGKREQKTIL